MPGVSRIRCHTSASGSLAKSQYDYCSDIVSQGVGSIEALAAALLNGSVWYFWWD